MSKISSGVGGFLAAWAEDFRQVNELREADSFGADLRREADRLVGFGEAVFGPVLFEEFQHHFTALGKAAFDDGGEDAVQFGRQQLGTWAGGQGEAGGIDFRLGEKAGGRNFEPAAGLVAQLEE